MRVDFGKGDELISLMGSVRPARVPKRRPLAERAPGEGIGVFLCECGGAVSCRVDVESLSNMASEMPGVVVSEVLEFPCSLQGRERIKRVIRERDLKGFVVAGCSPKTHERTFMTTAMEAGLNPMMFEMANIREQCAFVHRPPGSTEKARSLLRAAVAKCTLLSPAPFQRSMPGNRLVLVVGSGEAALSAASAVVDQGAEAVLVASSDLSGSPEAVASGKIQALTKSRIASFGGNPGDFFALVETPGGFEEVRCGAVILAMEADETPIDAGYPHVSQREFEHMLEGGNPPGRVVMILSGTPECGRGCAPRAIKNAMALRRMREGADVTIIGRDFVTPGTCELDYREASVDGVRFVRSCEEVEVRGGIVTVKDMHTGDQLGLMTDVVVTDVAYRANETDELASLFEVPVDGSGFFRRTQVKLKPSATLREGVFLCGSASGPRLPAEELLEAEVAASRAVALLSHEVETGGAVAEVDPERCSACLTCVRSCPFTAPFIGDSGKAEIELPRCQGCGVCVGICPSKAIDMHYYTDAQIEAQTAALLRKVVR